MKSWYIVYINSSKFYKPEFHFVVKLGVFITYIRHFKTNAIGEKYWIGNI